MRATAGGCGLGDDCGLSLRLRHQRWLRFRRETAAPRAGVTSPGPEAAAASAVFAGNDRGSPGVEALASGTACGGSVGNSCHYLVGGGAAAGGGPTERVHGHDMIEALLPGVAVGTISVGVLYAGGVHASTNKFLAGH